MDGINVGNIVVLYIPYVMLNIKRMGFRRQVDGTRSNKILYSISHWYNSYR